MTDTGFLNIANLENRWVLIGEMRDTSQETACDSETSSALHTHKGVESWENSAESSSERGTVHGSHQHIWRLSAWNAAGLSREHKMHTECPRQSMNKTKWEEKVSP